MSLTEQEKQALCESQWVNNIKIPMNTGLKHADKCPSRHPGMDCRDPEYKDVLIDSTQCLSKIDYKNQCIGCFTNTIHSNWIPAVHAGMTALRLDVNINSHGMCLDF